MRVLAACALLVAAFVVALLIGRGGGEDASPESATAAPEIETLPAPKPPDAPALSKTADVPDLKETPVSSTDTGSTAGSTGSTGTTSGSGTTSGGSTGGSSGGGSTGGGGGGGGSTPVAPAPG